MVIIVALAILFFIFFILRRHSGPAHLAMIAGLSVYEMFGEGLAKWLSDMWTAVPDTILKYSVYLALIVVFPLLLYLRSGHGGLRGILHVIEALIFAAVMVSLISEPLAYFFQFDNLSTQISAFIKNIEGTIVVIGIVSAYFDLLFASPLRSRRR